MKVNISVGTMLTSLNKDAYITIVDATTGELLFHGYRNTDTYIAGVLFEPYIVTGLDARHYMKKVDGLTLGITLEVTRKTEVEEND